jgi:hypothetical protein
MSWIGDLWTKITNAFSAAPAKQPISTCPGKPVSTAEAQRLFNKLKARKDIPFDYPPDCCYARATEMVDMLAAEGIQSKKVWTYGNLVPLKPDGSNVRFPPKPTGAPVAWGYHVAPTICVQQPDGTVSDMVMDPSLSDKPLTVQQWNKIMSGAGSKIEKTALSDSSVFYREDDGTGHYENDPGMGNRKTAFAGHIVERKKQLGY